MTAYEHPVDTIQRELREMRDQVATLACREKDQRSYKAYLTQARILRSMQEQITGLHSDITVRAIRSGLTDDARIEEEWLSALGDWLTTYADEAAANVRQAHSNADIGQSTRSGWLPFAVPADEKKAIYRVFAEKHEAMIRPFCERHAVLVRERAGEIEADLATAWSLQMSVTGIR